MRRLSLILPVWAFLSLAIHAQSPHGESFKVSCSQCHSAASWKLDQSVYAFDHNTTTMPLSGSHRDVSCRQCHTSLVFQEADNVCASCHTDIHENTTGPDCARCHNSVSWIVENTTALHRQSRFPLSGAHTIADCSECHPSASMRKFEPVGIECIDCHRGDFLATTSPNHVQSGYSQQCMECHSVNSFTWTWNGSLINHSFFPLTSGHAITDCRQCHTGDTYAGLSSECVSCHLSNYNQTTNPNHAAAQYPQTCNTCHSTTPGWKPATVNHSFFPLTQGHSITDCNACHTNGNYVNTSPECVSCHLSNYNQTTDPNHVAAQYPQTCNQCHSTNPGWKPASFDHSAFPLTLGHADVDCNQCHTNGYTNTSSDCYACHQGDYNQTTNPGHASLNLSTNCTSCHTTAPGWKPASFTIHDTYFPIYSGTHNGEWNSCTECHANTSDYSSFSCLGCHEHNQTDMDREHSGRDGYSYTSAACLECHPRGND